MAAGELPAAFKLLAELRPHLDEALFLAQVERQAAAHGYALFGAFSPGLVGLIGLREVETTARGKHLHVDDLIVAPECRKQGIGRALLSWAEARARERRFRSVYLDAIEPAREFYATVGYVPNLAVLLRKDVR